MGQRYACHQGLCDSQELLSRLEQAQHTEICIGRLSFPVPLIGPPGTAGCDSDQERKGGFLGTRKCLERPGLDAFFRSEQLYGCLIYPSSYSDVLGMKCAFFLHRHPVRHLLSPPPDLRRLCACPSGPHPATSCWFLHHAHARLGFTGANSGCSSSHLGDCLCRGHHQPDSHTDPNSVFGHSGLPR